MKWYGNRPVLPILASQSHGELPATLDADCLPAVPGPAQGVPILGINPSRTRSDCKISMKTWYRRA
jgi:hypothetical protein